MFEVIMKEMFFDLAKYRVQRAFESKTDAEILLKSDNVAESVNRIFQANFYAIKSLLAIKMKDSAKHQKVLNIFHESFVQSGEVPKEFGLTVDRSYRSRDDSEHYEQPQITRKDAESMIEEAERFLCFVREYLQQHILSNQSKPVEPMGGENDSGDRNKKNRK